MELVWDSRLSAPQEQVNTTSSRAQRRKQGLHMSLDNCDNTFYPRAASGGSASSSFQRARMFIFTA